MSATRPALLPRACHLTNLEVLVFVLGWYDGNVKMVADALGVTPGRVLLADRDELIAMCRTAQLCNRMMGTDR